jgi:glycosyltransferase involved in cell wall biosynthesis
MIVTNSLTGGGAERAMNLACNELTQRGWPISLVPINSGPPDQVIPMCEVFPLERKWRGSAIGTLRAMWRFHRIVNSWAPDVIVLNCDLPELFGATLFSRRCLVVVEHANRPWKTRIMFGRIIRRLLQLRHAKWATVSSHFPIWPNSLIPDTVLPNSILISRPKVKATMELTMTKKVKRLIFIGRLAPEKRPNWLVTIGEKTGLPLEIIGEGSMREAMEEAVTDGELIVHFRGRISDPWEAIEDGDLLIVPSEFEGDGLVVVEGMQKGIPMLISDIPDFRRFGLPEANYCKSVEDFIFSIDRFGANISSLMVPKNISTQILAARSPEAVGDKWEEFLNSI